MLHRCIIGVSCLFKFRLRLEITRFLLFLFNVSCFFRLYSHYFDIKKLFMFGFM